MYPRSYRVCGTCKISKLQTHQRKYSEFSSQKNQHEWKDLFEQCIKNKNASIEDWYRSDPQTILNSEASKVLKKEFKGSMFTALSTLFPEQEWHPWKFKYQKVPAGYWHNIAHLRRFFDVLGQKVGIKHLDDWYTHLNQKIIEENGGGFLRKQFKGSATKALMACYPEHNWMPWRFSKAHLGFWKSMDNQKMFFNWLGNKLGVETMDDWYRLLSTKVVQDNGGGTLIQTHGSASSALMKCYPDYPWMPWKFASISAGFWESPANRRQYFDWLATQSNVKHLDDWYHVLSSKLIVDNYGATLLDVHKSCVSALTSTYPEHNWLIWKFRHAPAGFWKSRENQRQFFEWLAEKIDVTSLDDWYKLLNTRVVLEHGGAGLIDACGSVKSALMACYPDHSWQPWKFVAVPSKFFRSTTNLASFLAHLSQQLFITTLDDWYRVEISQLYQLGATQVMQKYGGLYHILKQVYPDHEWDPLKFHHSKKAQRWLCVAVRKLFPDVEVLEDFAHPKAAYAVSKRPLQFDVFIPSMSMAFEYQGKQHYDNVGIFQPAKLYQQRDQEKRQFCADNNIKLVEVPYWWNRTQEGLQQLIPK